MRSHLLRARVADGGKQSFLFTMNCGTCSRVFRSAADLATRTPQQTFGQERVWQGDRLLPQAQDRVHPLVRQRPTVQSNKRELRGHGRKNWTFVGSDETAGGLPPSTR